MTASSSEITGGLYTITAIASIYFQNERNYRIGAREWAKRYEQQGQGLGLTLARRLAELHGGELAIESIPAQGTTVRVTLPLA
jgi:signal transduction histidine kinase